MADPSLIERHTPGPWIVNPFNAQVDCQVVSEKGGLLPVCQMLWPTEERSEAETEANAKLIADAPTMKATLEDQARLIGECREGLEFAQVALSDGGIPATPFVNDALVSIDALITKLNAFGERDE